jgi:hypothetical protein
MLAPLLVLAACCAWIGLLPGTVSPWLDRSGAIWLGSDAATSAALPPIASLVPLGAVSAVAGLLLAGCAAGAFAYGRLRDLRPALRRGGARVVTWDCGYFRPTARMQYTASSFADGVVGFLRGVLLPRVDVERPRGVFPSHAGYHGEVADVVLDRGGSRGSSRGSAISSAGGSTRTSSTSS